MCQPRVSVLVDNVQTFSGHYIAQNSSASHTTQKQIATLASPCRSDRAEKLSKDLSMEKHIKLIGVLNLVFGLKTLLEVEERYFQKILYWD